MKTASIDWAHLSSGPYEGHYQYWQGQLSTFGSGFQLSPLSIPHLEVGRRESRSLELKQAQDHPNELAAFTLFLAGIGVLLSKYEKRDRVLLHSPRLSAGMMAPAEFDARVPLQIESPGEMEVRSFLNSLRNSLKNSYTFQDYPFAQLESSGQAFHSNVAVAWSRIHRTDDLFESSYGLSMSLMKEDKGFSVRYNYDNRAFDSSYIDQFHLHLEELLFQMKNMDAKIGDLSLKAFVNKKSGESKVKSPLSLDILWKEAVANHATRRALTSAEGDFTFGELDQKVDRLAKAFQEEYGLKSGARIGILLPSSLMGVVSMLAAWKAGMTYIPIDPTYPEARIRYILEDSSPALLIAESEQLFKLSYYPGQLLAIDIQYDMFADGSPLPPEGPSTDLSAYIIYTSGSTGKPKGVEVSQGALAATLDWRMKHYSLGPGQVMLQLFSPAFDGFLTSAFSPLLAGCHLVLPTDQERANPEVLSDKITEHKVSHLIATPSLYGHLMSRLQEDPQNLKAITLAGEALSTSLVEAHLKAMPKVGLYNEFGLTETAVCCTAGIIRPGEALHIGTAIEGAEIFIWDEKDHPQPALVAGEIIVGGKGMAKGYLGLPELNKERFVEGTLEDGNRGRLYRTGDLGRWLPDGRIEFLGRKDNQIKFNGYRIEMDGIKKCIESYPGIGATFLCLEENEDQNGRRLTAYVAHSNENVGDEIRKHLQSQLPAYMIPSSIVVLAKLPMTVHGKVDRAALRNSSPSEIPVEQKEAPENEIEQTLVDIWQEVLGKPQIGTGQSFFDLGGDSIKAVQIAARLQDLDYVLEVRDIFEHHKIKSLANFLTHSSSSDAHTQMEASQPETSISAEDLDTINSIMDR